jgi:hypothetical protein
MAARENQGYLIAVIVLVLLTLILALTTFLGFTSSSQHADGEAAAKQSLEVEKRTCEAYQIQSSILKSYVGDLGGNVQEVATQMDAIDRLTAGGNLTDNQKKSIDDVKKELSDIKTAYENDMKLFIRSEEEQQTDVTTWRSLVQNLNTVLARKHNEVNVHQNETNRMREETKAKIDAKQKTVDETLKQLETARTEYEAEKNRNKETEQKLSAALADMTEKNSRDNKNHETERDTLRKEISDLSAKVAALGTENTSLKDKVNRYEQENIDLPDGKVVRVAHAIGKVFLDVGRADGLRPNMTISIYDRNDNNFQAGGEKAAVQVTKISGAHQSEARITSENPARPILSGDFVVTPTWDPGFSVPIALAGVFDLDFDNIDDRQRVITMIENNGGKVVAHHDEEGSVIGKIDSSTRYFVRGEPPTGVNQAANEAVFNAIRDLSSQAEQHSVQEIDIRKMLNWMGRHGHAKVEHLDEHIGVESRKREADSYLKSSDQ